MMPLCASHWSFETSWPALALAFAAFALMAWFSWRAYARSGGRRGLLVLEGLRLLLCALILFTLLRPERVIVLSQAQAPQVAVLCDQSGSMASLDVQSGNGVVSRAQWLKAAVEGPVLEPLRQAYQTTVVPFSSRSEGIRKETEGTDLSLALGEKLSVFRNLRAVLLMTDGDWNTGENPAAAAAQLRARGVPVYALRTGADRHLPDVELSGIRFPAFCLAREKVSIPFEVTNHLDRELRTRAAISENGAVQAEREVEVAPGETFRGTLVWAPPATGKHTIKLSVPVQAGEVNEANNAREFAVDVRQEKLRVLVVESVPRWEYRFLRNALSRDPDIEVSTLLLQPGIGPGVGAGYLAKFPDKQELAQYDVVFVGDIGVGKSAQDGELTHEQAAQIRTLVEAQGGGVVFLPGVRGRSKTWAGSALDDMIPVELDASKPQGISSAAETRFQLTDLGSKHLLTMLADSPAGNAMVWRGLPGFTWNAAVKRARIGAELLAVNPVASCESGRMPVLVIRPFGGGQALFMGIDSAWRWRKGVEDLYHYRFWGQVVRWMAHKRHLAHDQGVRLFYAPENPMAGQSVRWNALLSDRSGFPVLKEDLKATLLDPEGKPVETFLFSEVAGDFGGYEAKSILAKSGIHTLKLTGAKSGTVFEAKVEVSAETREVVGRPARGAPLVEIAHITKGAFGGTDELAALVAQIKALPKAADIEERQALWSQWWWGAILLALLGVYWTLRKWMGLV